MVSKFSRRALRIAVLGMLAAASVAASVARADDKAAPAAEAKSFRLATFSAEVTPAIGHPLLGGASGVIAKSVDDPLFAMGCVLLGGEKPIVLCSIDWCEIRNDAYDRWRDALAEAAGTTRERVLVACIHQHDAPLADLEAQRILERSKAPGKVIDLEYHERCVERTAKALKESLGKARPVTQLGLGMGKVEKVASNRRFVTKDGKLSFNRSSMSGGKADQAEADEGEIDPYVRTISFWDGDKPICAVHSYAVHPMSKYGLGAISADFPGLARKLRQADDPNIMQIHFAGASGDTTAGKYNDGNIANRAILAERLHQGMVEAWKNTNRVPLKKAEFRNAQVVLLPRDNAGYKIEEMTAALKNPELRKQSLAAMSLSARKRFDAKQPIDVPVVDFGPAQIVLLPGEVYVYYQLLAQKLRPDIFVFTIGFGESTAGYLPPERAWQENDGNMSGWGWIAPHHGEKELTDAMRKAMQAK